MNLQSPKLYSFVLLLSMLAGGTYLLNPEFGRQYEWVFFIVVMLVTGIPHGATDHVVYEHCHPSKKRKNPLLNFLAFYLGAMMVYGFCWFFFPLFSLALFILISAYHFGQSQLLSVKWEELSPVKVLLYLSWGLTVLVGIIGFHFKESMEILGNLVAPDSLPTEQGQWLLAAGITAAIWGSLMLFSLIGKRASAVFLFFEVLNLGLILLLSALTSVLFSFALYFGIWHSLASINNEIKILRGTDPGFSWKSFAWKALPFSLMSILGIGLLIFLGNSLGGEVSPYLLFFIAISTLTLPHTIFMQRLYQQGEKQPHKQSGLFKVEG